MRQARLVSVNGFFLVAVLSLAVLVDGNGRILSLGAAMSCIMAAVVFVVACGAAGILIWKGRGWARWLGVVLIGVYVVMLLPVILL